MKFFLPTFSFQEKVGSGSRSKLPLSKKNEDKMKKVTAF